MWPPEKSPISICCPIWIYTTLWPPSLYLKDVAVTSFAVVHTTPIIDRMRIATWVHLVDKFLSTCKFITIWSNEPVLSIHGVGSPLKHSGSIYLVSIHIGRYMPEHQMASLGFQTAKGVLTLCWFSLEISTPKPRDWRGQRESSMAIPACRRPGFHLLYHVDSWHCYESSLSINRVTSHPLKRKPSKTKQKY